MSWWVSPTTADTGIRAFESSRMQLFATVLEGMQSMILDRSTAMPSNPSLRTSEVSLDAEESSDEQLLVTLLEEALYEAEVHERWWVQVILDPTWFVTRTGRIQALVSWVPICDVDPILHIKAITRHSLIVGSLDEDEIYPDPAQIGPEFVGPGYHAHVIFDV